MIVDSIPRDMIIEAGECVKNKYFYKKLENFK
jgi:hypothetical protein